MLSIRSWTGGLVSLEYLSNSTISSKHQSQNNTCTLPVPFWCGAATALVYSPFEYLWNIQSSCHLQETKPAIAIYLFHQAVFACSSHSICPICWHLKISTNKSFELQWRLHWRLQWLFGLVLFHMFFTGPIKPKRNALELLPNGQYLKCINNPVLPRCVWLIQNTVIDDGFRPNYNSVAFKYMISSIISDQLCTYIIITGVVTF